MPNYNVTYAELTDTANRLTGGKDELIAKLNELQAAVNNLVSSGFQTDQASGAFQTSYESFTQGATEMVNGLEGMSQFLTQSSQAMQDLDAQLASGIGG